MRTRNRNVRLITVVAAVLLLAALGSMSLNQNEATKPVFADVEPDAQNSGASPKVPTAASVRTAEPSLAPVSMHYDPSAIKVGDHLTGLKLIKIESGTYGKGSIVSVWDGELQLSGTYEYLYQEAAYNSGQVIFIPDAASAAKLPQPKAFEGQSMRFVLHFTKAEDKQKFGPPGSMGSAALIITSYASVYAGILEGTSDIAAVQTVSDVQVTLPPITQISNSELDGALKDFPVLKQLELTSDIETLRKVQDWIYNVDHSLLIGLAHSGKRISVDQRERIRIWLSQAFTDQKAFQLLDILVPASEGGNIMGGGLSGLRASSEVRELKDQKFVNEKDGTVTYKVTYVLHGTQDAYLNCQLVPVDSQWKIGVYTIGYY
ncbi:hypothetical protein [Paenibacillus sp. GP183]|uniref:hypothetical protein n=1 Tax=Paenibacillus sp. GP183 TaxID=1882751 RepID=UPI00089A56DD|nr:hypothetical protein [Paenibacillus sp. GP183]SEB40981.1 hypothetical protein SAMN05443246_0103 [Paenibacillus sp. GP183]